MQILNKNVNMRNDIAYKTTTQSKVEDVDKEYVEKVISVSEMLTNEDKNISNIDDLERANEVLSNERKMVRVRKLDDKQAGFISICSITLIGTLVMVMSIFATIKMIVLG